jgi:ribose transport system ATP-binding protein
VLDPGASEIGPTEATVPALSLRRLSKTFPGQRALDSVDLVLAPGEIHGLIGQNGSGKSTLVKVLAGYHVPDPGAGLDVGGRDVTLGSPHAARQAGLRFVHQDLGLVASLSVADNFALGTAGSGGLRRLRRDTERARAATAIAHLGYAIDPRSPVGDLSASERTIVAVARALENWQGQTHVLVVDEATASLPWAESKRLLESIRLIAGQGVAVIFVSHHLDEVISVTSRVTVLRDGRCVARLDTASVSQEDLAEAMLGRKLLADSAAPHATPHVEAEPALRVRALRGDSLSSLDLDLRPGQVIGIAGLTGSGREEVAALLAGASARGGTVEVNGFDLPAADPAKAVAAGVCLVPADRVSHALLPTGTVRENVTLAGLDEHTRFGRLRHRAEKAEVTTWINELSIRPAHGELPILSLSGGNQQKTVIARWLRRRPVVLILDEPTQGVDIGSKVDIHRLIDRAAADGSAIIVCSTDSAELERLCTSVLVIHRGVVVGRLSGPDVTADAIEEQQFRAASPLSESVLESDIVEKEDTAQ